MNCSYLMMYIAIYLMHFGNVHCRFWVVWPRGISWWSWRMQMGFDGSYAGFYIPYLYEWGLYNYRTKWKYSEYEEPLYFRKFSSFVPSYLRRNCDADGIDARNLHYYSGREDMRRGYSELKKLGGSYYYDNVYYHEYVAFLYNVCSCLRGNSISYTCPDPCRKPDMCVSERNVVKGSCRQVPDKNRVSKLLNGDFKNIFGSIYEFRADCTCKQGFAWNSKAKTCDFVRAGCSLKRIGDKVCRHGGKCLPVPSGEREYDFQILRCVCPAAWSGYLCTEPVNPCKFSKKLCGSFICRRDETSTVKAYYCICTKGFRRFNDFEPRCVNIDECQFAPCQHGGKCKDLVPDPLNPVSLQYVCECIKGFTGDNCEIPPKRPQWSMWGSWSICSKSCGIGRLVRFRNCSEMGRCSGLSTQTTACILLGQSCDFLANSDQENQLKLSGIGWTAEEERIIDDAFHWNEQLTSENPYDTLHYLTVLQNVITVILCVLSIPLVLICTFNIIMMKPHQWLMMSLRSHIIRKGWGCGGNAGRLRRQRRKEHAKKLKVLKQKKKEKNAQKHTLGIPLEGHGNETVTAEEEHRDNDDEIEHAKNN